MGEIIFMPERPMGPHTNVFALCLECKTKWFAKVEIGTSLFQLECPHCQTHNSFPSFIPDKYLEDIVADNESVSEE